jgi:uncharacterized protein YjbI with pentapeptide repeats
LDLHFHSFSWMIQARFALSFNSASGRALSGRGETVSRPFQGRMVMANPVHIEAVKNGPEALRNWQQHNEDVSLDLSEADLRTADLRTADLREANLRGVNLRGADLVWAKLSDAKLSGADLSEAKLSEAKLSGADLSGADLRGADLRGANLRWARLSEANLRGADLTEADLRGADLRGADLGSAQLHLANLNEANLRGADFDDAICVKTVFGSVDLSEVKHLDIVRHRGPSTVGVDTFYKSRGKIPEAFLRGCGVPDTLIDYLPSLTGSEKAIEFYSCFISYSHKDEKFATRLHSRMQQEHLRVWYAPEDLHGGRKIHEEIDQAIRVFDKLLLVLSEQSMKSEWVMTEIRKARKVERETKRRKLFPIRLVDFETIRDWECFDADGGKDLAVEVREYLIPDFAKWKNHDAFEAAFERLLRDLRADEIKEEKK